MSFFYLNIEYWKLNIHHQFIKPSNSFSIYFKTPCLLTTLSLEQLQTTIDKLPTSNATFTHMKIINRTVFFAVMYFLFGLATATPVIFTAFFIYGIYAAATESMAKAWITNMAHSSATATAVGFYTSCQSLCSLLASAAAGLLWSTVGPPATFLFPAVAALSLFCYFFFLPKTTIVM